MRVLILDSTESIVVAVALAVWATQADDEGRDEDAKIADGVHDRVCALRDVDRDHFREWVNFAGCGRNRNARYG